MGAAAKAKQAVRCIVSNTGPLLHLSEARALQILSYAGEVHIPKAVEAEMSRLDPPWRTPSWIMVDSLDAPQQNRAQTWQQAGLLDRGEAEAIALAQQIQARLAQSSLWISPRVLVDAKAALRRLR